MKYNVLLLTGILLITVYSCQEKSDNSIVETKTNLSIDIPIVAEISDNTKSESSTSKIDYLFSGEGAYSKENLANPGKDIYNIQNIKPENGSVLSFSGMNESDEVYSLLLEWGYKTSANDDYVMQEPIDLLSFENMVADGIFTVKMDEALAQMIKGDQIDQNYSFEVRITGKSNFNINCIAKLKIPVNVQSEAITAHFELF